MLTEHRKRLLLDHLQNNGRIIAKEMSVQLKLSEDTIRRDLRELAADGKLLRVHGGALPFSPTVKPLSVRTLMASDEKQKLGRAAANLVHSGQTIFIDGGTTNLELAKALHPNLCGTVVTHSPTIAAAFEVHANISVIIIGGVLFRHSMVALGAAALESINNMHFDTCFIGANGLHISEGLTTGHYEEALFKRAVIARSAEVYSLITQDKLGTAAAQCICKPMALPRIVSLKTTNSKFLKSLKPHPIWVP
jgi:DeoR/GlpR family transcriptional regulator of sugar metabolism